MQETWVRSLVQEDPTCHRATKPVHYNYWACAPEAGRHNYWSPYALEPVLRSKRSHCNGKPTPCHKEWPLLAATRESLWRAMKTRHKSKKKGNPIPPSLTTTVEKPVQQWGPSTTKTKINKFFKRVVYHLNYLSPVANLNVEGNSFIWWPSWVRPQND